jgi:hypothetical protein
MVKEVKRFGDLAPPPLACDEKIDKDTILNTDVLWLDFQELSGKHGAFIWVVVEDLKDKTKLGFSTGASVVIKRLKKAKEKRLLPLKGKLVKPAEYYDII